MASSTEIQKWLEKVKAVAPVIEEHRDEGERERRLPDSIFNAMHSAGLYDVWMPRSLGGAQADIETGLAMIEAVARCDGSAAWNLMIGLGHGIFADYVSDEAAKEIFSGNTMTAGSFAPNGEATPVDNGYRLSGHWSFASGCQQASWLVAGANVPGVGGPTVPGGVPSSLILLIPASKAEIIDTWQTGGMRGTGSHDFVIHDAFVPTAHSFPLAKLFSGPTLRPSTGHRQPFMLIGPLAMGALSLGIARDAIDSMVDLAMRKTPRGASPLLGHHTLHQRVGDAEALVGSARAYLYLAANTLEAASEATDEVAALVRLAATHAARAAGQAAGLMYEAGGGSSIYSTSRLDRCFRDVNVASHHILVSPGNIEMVGQYHLGLGLQRRR